MAAFSFPALSYLLVPTFLLVLLTYLCVPNFFCITDLIFYSSTNIYIPFNHSNSSPKSSRVVLPTPDLLALTQQIPPYDSPSFATYDFSQNINKMSRLHFKRKKSRLEKKKEEDLAEARAAIYKAIHTRNYTSNNKDETFIPRGCIYRNAYAFHQSHIEMMKRFKVWAYKEGEQPLVHSGPAHLIYSIEGHFIDEMENGKSPFTARHPDEAHVFFLPISVVYIVEYIYMPVTDYRRDRMVRVVKDYVNLIANRYPYWNRSKGADHFMLSCHDWAPAVTFDDPELFTNFIRVLCNANTSEGFKPTRDVSMPEFNLDLHKLTGQLSLGQPPNKRPILGFFAGGSHGDIRSMLFEHWKGKDDEIQVFEKLPKQLGYKKLMEQSKFCLCPSGWEVASPRVVEAIQSGCVPVIISDHYALPFDDVFDWTKFSIHIPSNRITDIKKILKGVSYSKYLKMQRRVTKVQRHFELNRPAEPFDVLHMVLHSLWLRRLNIKLPI